MLKQGLRIWLAAGTYGTAREHALHPVTLAIGLQWKRGADGLGTEICPPPHGFVVICTGFRGAPFNLPAPECGRFLAEPAEDEVSAERLAKRRLLQDNGAGLAACRDQHKVRK